MTKEKTSTACFCEEITEHRLQLQKGILGLSSGEDVSIAYFKLVAVGKDKRTKDKNNSYGTIYFGEDIALEIYVVIQNLNT
jgi:hypothetical protein